MNKNPERHRTIDEDISHILNPMDREKRKYLKIEEEIGSIVKEIRE